MFGIERRRHAGLTFLAYKACWLAYFMQYDAARLYATALLARLPAEDALYERRRHAAINIWG
jgi:hypothetical protein